MSRALKGFYRQGSFFSEYLAMVEGVTEAPVRFHIGAAAALLGAMIGRRLMLKFGHHKLYVITPAILVGPSGIGKGEALGIAKAVLKGAKTELRDGEPQHTMWILEDEATPSALIRCFSLSPFNDETNERNYSEVAIIAGEMATFMARTGEKEGMVPIITKLLEQDDSYVRTLAKDLDKRNHQAIQNPTLSFMAGTTVDWMRKMMPSEMFAGGFFRRCLMVCEERKGRYLDWPVELSSTRMSEFGCTWMGRFEKAFSKDPGNPRKMTMEPSMAIWKAFKRRHDSSRPEDPRLVGHYNSHPQHVLRTAMMFAAADLRTTVEPQDLRDAEAFVTSLLPDVRSILLQGEVYGFKEQAQLLERIMIEQGRISKKELRLRIRVPENQFDDLINWGAETGILKAATAKELREGEVGKWYYSPSRRKDVWGRRSG